MSQPTETGCCPRFDPEPWQDREIVWDAKLFVRDRVRCVLHIPLNFGAVMKRTQAAIQAAGAVADAPMVVSDENSLWGADVFVAVSRQVPGARMAAISGRFLTRVFEGPYRNMRTWVGEMRTHVDSKRRTLRRLLFYYPTCPKCAAVYGKNYVVLLAEV